MENKHIEILTNNNLQILTVPCVATFNNSEGGVVVCPQYNNEVDVYVRTENNNSYIVDRFLYTTNNSTELNYDENNFDVNVVMSYFTSGDSRGFLKCEGEITSIENSAFTNSTNLTLLRMPYSVENIGDYAFSNCSSIKRIVCQNQTPPTLGTNVFEGLPQNGDLLIPDGSDYLSWLSVLPIGWSFGRCVKIYYSDGTSRIFTYKDGEIPDKEFSGNTDIVKAEIGKEITVIHDSAFRQCTNLSSITFSDDVVTLGKQVAHTCTNLVEVTFGSGLTNIGNDSFKTCSSLSSVTINAEVAPVLGNTNVFNGHSINGTLNINSANRASYNVWANRFSGWTVNYIP